MFEQKALAIQSFCPSSFNADIRELKKIREKNIGNFFLKREKIPHVGRRELFLP